MSVSIDELRRSIREVVREEMVRDQGQETHVDHVCGCPNCLCGIMDRLNKTSDYACAHCGFPLGNEAFMKKLEKCPNCGRAGSAMKVER